MLLLKKWLPLPVVSLLLSGGLVLADTSRPSLTEEVFAVVDGVEISGREFMAALRDGGRRRFYHGRPPEEELLAFRREVGEELIDRRLLVAEAKRRNTPIDREWVDTRLENYTRQLADVPEWQENAEELLPQLRRRIEEDSQVRLLEEAVRGAVTEPTEQQLREFYGSNKELFTTPEQNRVAAIVFRLPPWAPPQQWEEIGLKARAVWAQLEEGASFAELASLHSQDPSADQGGDLGFLHKDMLGGGVQEAVDKLSPGEYTEPLRTLDGWVIVQLVERKPPTLNPFEAVRERAKALWIRRAREEAWENLKKRLRREARIAVNERFYEEPSSLPEAAVQETGEDTKK
ncbi:MAG: hypothetical protein Kow006_09820 [Gammaproteobacteria bacterium]